LRGFLTVLLLTLLSIYFLGASLLKLPFIQIKRYDVYGLRPSELPKVEELLREKGKLLLVLPEELLLKEVNRVFYNRFKSVELKRHFGLDGASLVLVFHRREPFALLKTPEGSALVDEEGVVFVDEGARPGLVLSLKTDKPFKKYWPVIKRLLSGGRELTLEKHRSLLKAEGKLFVLPSVELLTGRHARLVEYAKGTEGKEIDLRYESFILLR